LADVHTLPPFPQNIQVFLSQLFRRARLVNPAFQRRVADIVWLHAAAHDADAEAVDAAYAVGGMRHGSLCSLAGPAASVWVVAERAARRAEMHASAVDCSFAGGVAGSVEVWAAPIKTMARMREKIIECAPHPPFRDPPSHQRLLVGPLLAPSPATAQPHFHVFSVPWSLCVCSLTSLFRQLALLKSQ
jgi:hypothetical protein